MSREKFEVAGQVKTLECIKKSVKLDHEKYILDLSAQEKLDQYLYLLSGAADMTDEKKGVNLGLEDSLKNRLKELHEHILEGIAMLDRCEA